MLVARLGYVFLVGLAFETFMLAWHPAHISGGLVWQDFAPMAAVGIGLFLGQKGKHTFLVKPRRSDAIFLVLAGIMSLGIIVHFLNFPIFPEFLSADLRSHVLFTEAISYNLPGIQSSLLYGGIHLLLGSLLLFQSGDPLILIQEGMGILTVLSLLAVYLSAMRLFGSETKALMVSTVYALGGFVWFGFVFNVGLYPNFLALIAGAFLVVAFIDSLKGKWSSVGIFGIALAFAFFSHYSIITLFPALVAVGLYNLAISVKNKQNRLSNIVILLLMTAPLAIGILLFPDLVSALRATLQGGGALALAGDYTFMASLFSPIPVLSFMFQEMTSDIVSIALILLAVFGAVKSRKEPVAWVMIIWLATLLVLAPFNNVAWRYSLIALFPLTYLAGSGIASLIESRSAITLAAGFGMLRMSAKNVRKIKAGLFILLMFFVFSGGWTVHAFVSTDQLAEQSQIDSALKWVQANGTGSIITPTDWRFQFSNLYGGQQAFWSCSLVVDPNIAFLTAVQHRATYIAITRQMACSNYPCFQQDVITLSVRNSTKGRTIIINAFEFNKNNGTAGVIVDNQTIGSLTFVNGNATSVVGFRDVGHHDVYVRFHQYVSNTEKVVMGSDVAPESIPVPLDSCYPFQSWDSLSLHGASVVFQSKDVRVFCIVSTNCVKDKA